MKYILRVLPEVTSEDAAKEVLNVIRKILPPSVHIVSFSTEKYWKIESLYDIFIEFGVLNPQMKSMEIVHELLKSMGEGWHIKGDELEGFAIWTKEEGFFVDDRVEWANLEFYKQNADE